MSAIEIIKGIVAIGCVIGLFIILFHGLYGAIKDIFNRDR